MAEEILEENKTLKIAVDQIPASSPLLHSFISPTSTAASSSKLNPDAPAFAPRSPAAAPPPASSAPPQPVNSNRRGPDLAGRSNQRGRGQSDGPNQQGGLGPSAGSNQRGWGRTAFSNQRGATANLSAGLNERGGRANRSVGTANRSAGPNQRGAKANRSGGSNRSVAKANWLAGSKQRGVKITNQVEYYFNDINLATTEQLMKFIRMDQEGEGFMPVSVVASFKKIMALVPKNPFLAYALRTSSELVVSVTGMRVKQTCPISGSVVDEEQMEYYFSDRNLATTEHLMKFIGMDQEGEGFAVASFMKIKALVPKNLFLAYPLRTSSELVVSETGMRVKQTRPINVSVMDELQCRIVVSENLPNWQYKGLDLHFASPGSVKAIWICNLQKLRVPAAATNKEKPYMYHCSKITRVIITHMDDGYLADDEGDEDDEDEDDDDDDENNANNQQPDEELGEGEVINDEVAMDVDRVVLNLNDTRTIAVIGPVASGTTTLIENFIQFCDPVHRLEDGTFLVGFVHVVLRILELNDLAMNFLGDAQPEGFVLCHDVHHPLDHGELHQWITAARMRSFVGAYVIIYGTRALEVGVGSAVEHDLAAFSQLIDRSRYFSAHIFLPTYPPPADAFDHLVNSL